MRAVVVLAIPLLWIADALEIWQLYVVAGAVGVASVFFDVAYQSYIPVLVDDDVVEDANGKLESTAQVARLGGPALAGALLKVVSAPVLLVVNAVGFAAKGAGDDGVVQRGVAGVAVLRRGGLQHRQVTARQRLCPRRLLGRMNASMRFVVWGVMPLASLLAGWLGSAFGTVPAMWVGVGIGVLSTLPFLTGPYGRMRELPTRPE